jgi:hypothetical protein
MFVKASKRRNFGGSPSFVTASIGGTFQDRGGNFRPILVRTQGKVARKRHALAGAG